MTSIERVPTGVRLTIEPPESGLLRTLLDQMLALLGESPAHGDPALAGLGIDAGARKSDDPVLARLFPDAYGDDAAAAGEFRRYTEVGLRDGKRAAIETVLAALPAPAADAVLELDEEHVQIWLRAINDVRLALGTRLEITEDWYEQVDELDWEDPRHAMFAAYEWLTMLQEGLVQALPR